MLTNVICLNVRHNILGLKLMRSMFINYKLMFGHNILYPRGTKQDHTLYVWPFLLHTENGLRIPLKGKHKRGFKMSPLRPSVPQSFSTVFSSVSIIFYFNDSKNKLHYGLSNAHYFILY
jgi:hypothetical protein